jgi:uncharacterized protein YqeY
MPKRQDLEADLKNAMRAGDDTRKRTLRMLLSAIKLAEVDKRGELDDSEMTTVIQREVKSRHETIHDAKQANRPDLVTAAEQEMEVLQAYLPEPLSDGELEGLVQRAIEECGATSPAEMGKVMKILMPQVQGRADGKTVSERVRQSLSAS